jgi:hypothetical protein
MYRIMRKMADIAEKFKSKMRMDARKHENKQAI